MLSPSVIGRMSGTAFDVATEAPTARVARIFETIEARRIFFFGIYVLDLTGLEAFPESDELCTRPRQCAPRPGMPSGLITRRHSCGCKEEFMPVMSQMEREQMIECVDFFARQVKRRVWDSFNDFEEQVQAHGEEVYEALGSAIGSEYTDMADIAEFALDDSIKFSELLFELKRDMTLASVAAALPPVGKGLETIFIAGIAPLR